MRHPFGSYAWARRSDGKLTHSERLAELFRGARSLASDRASHVGRLLGVHPRAIRMLLDDVPIPQTPLVTAAERALGGAPPWVLAHSMRTYVWAFLLGRRDGLGLEAELLLVASLLHDIGLVQREGASCYALRGAEKARAIALAVEPPIEGGGHVVFADRIADAISTHLNVRPSRMRSDTRLIRAGAGLDVVGDRFDHVDRETRRSVVGRWPRDGFAIAIRDLLRDEAKQHPDTRIGFLCHRLGFLRLIDGANRRFESDGAPD